MLEISGFCIFCVSKEATSTMIRVIGRIFFSFSMSLMWLSSLCLMLGASQPFFPRLLNRGSLYHLRLLRVRRYALRFSRSRLMSLRKVNSPAMSSLPATALKPTVEYPASMPRVTPCLYPLEPYNSCIVNGVRLTTTACPLSSKCLALAGDAGISGFPCLFSTNTNIKCSSCFRVNAPRSCYAGFLSWTAPFLPSQNCLTILPQSLELEQHSKVCMYFFRVTSAYSYAS